MTHLFCTTIIRVRNQKGVKINMDKKPFEENNLNASTECAGSCKLENDKSCVNDSNASGPNECSKSSNCLRNCKCGDECTCRKNTSESKQCGMRCKNCLATILSVISCVIACTALSRTSNSNKPTTHASRQQNQNVSGKIEESKIRSTIIDVIKNDPQLLIDAMSTGIAKQRTDLSKQQVLNVEKYKSELIDTAYVLGDKDANTTILCLFDPICSSCIDFQHMMLTSLKNRKNICFYIIPVAALGERSEEVAKAYYAVYAKDPTKLIDFISELIKDPSALESAMKSVSLSQKDFEKFRDVVNQKMETNLNWLNKLQINSVPAIFIKNGSGNFASIDENELISIMK